mgnify:CR=1 FL=1
MLLCLDAGNTRLKFGLREGAEWRAQGALEYASFNALEKRLPALPTRIVACNVAGEPARQRIEALAASLQVRLDWLQSSAVACGVSNGYDMPQQLGSDRWAALIGARGQQARACLVVLAILLFGIGTFAKGGEFNRRNANKIMRWRLGAQFVAVVIIVLVTIDGHSFLKSFAMTLSMLAIVEVVTVWSPAATLRFGT